MSPSLAQSLRVPPRALHREPAAHSQGGEVAIFPPCCCHLSEGAWLAGPCLPPVQLKWPGDGEGSPQFSVCLTPAAL